MPGLLSLPTELLQAIGQDLGSAKKQLRLVCTHLSSAMDPLVFSHVVIDVTQPRLPTIVSQLRLLAQTRTCTAQLVHELSIRSLVTSHEPRSLGAQMAFSGGSWTSAGEVDIRTERHFREEVVKEYLEGAIANMVNLRIVRWKVVPRDSDWATLAVINALSRIHSLNYLNLHLSFVPDASCLRLDLLHGLKCIVISGSCGLLSEHIVKPLGSCIAQCPGVTSIDIDTLQWHGTTEAPSLCDLLRKAPVLRLEHLGLHNWCTRFDNTTLPHLHFLKSLTLTNNRTPGGGRIPSASSTEDIWSALQANKIHLQQISTDAVDASLVEYLSSYSGLKRLYLKNITIPDLESSKQLAEMFFDAVSNWHSHTLEDLYVLPLYEDRWCFGKHVLPIFLRCSKLEYLKFSVISSEINPSGPDDIIRLLITSVAHHLRSLKGLSISTARAQSLRGHERTGLSAKHFSFVNEQIAKAITTYIPPSEYYMSLPTVVSNTIKYVPQIRNRPEVDGAQSSQLNIRYCRIN